MRLASIAFAPFGALRDVSLDFTGPPGALHVIWGPNEAGKSTALRGIVGFFFQIDRLSRDQHTAGLELRVRARLELPDGTTAHLVRRKGTKDPLRDGDSDAPVSELTLSRWMGGIDKETFLQLHALDHVRLRLGSEAILRGHGKLGELLLEASTGAVGLSERLDALREEADALFRPRSRKTALAVAVDEWQTAQRAVATQALSPQAWKDQEAAIAELRQRVEDTEALLKKAKEEHARLTRLAALGDPWRRLGKKRARRRELGVVADVKEGTAKLRDAHAQQLAEARADAAKAADDLAQLRARLEAVRGRAASVSPTFDLAAGRAIRERLDAAGRARSEAIADREAIERVLAETMGRLGPAPAGRAWTDFSIDARALSRAQARATALRDANTALGQAARGLSEARSRVERRAGLAEPRTDEPSLSAREEAVAAGRRAVAAARTRDDLAAREHSLVGRLAALVAASGLEDAESLVGASCPSDDALAAEERARADADAELTRCLRELDLATERARGSAIELSTLREASALPTEEELGSARARRAALLDEVAAALEAGDVRAAATPLRAAVHATHAADAVADRLRREASRVERAARLEVESKHDRDRLDALGTMREALLEAAERRRTRWDAAWPALAGLSPTAARAWAIRRGEAAALRAELDSTRDRREELDAEVAAALAALGRAGENGPADGTSTSLEGSLARAERATEEQRARLRARDERAATLAMAIDAEGVAEREVARATAAAESAREGFAETVATFGLPADVMVDEAMAVLSALSEVSRERRRQEVLVAKIAGIAAAEAEALAEWEHATRETGLAGVAPEEAIALAERAREARAEVERLEEAIATRVGIEVAAARRAERAAAGLAAIAEQAGVPAEQLAQAEERAREARALDQEIAQLGALVAERLGAADVEAAEQELRPIDLDLVDEKLESVAATLAELEATRDRAQRSIGAQELGLANLGSESRAAEQAENAEAYLARARGLARRAAVAWAAVALLEREVERHRQEREGPVLRRASDIFRGLTLGRWEGLRVGEAPDGEPEIRCVRDERELGVDALSVGTADQLYLALRLAALEHHAKGGSTLPVVLDDVLVHFDEDRKGAALEALADVSRTVQVLLFSHDRRVADLAREVLGPTRVVIHELGRTP